MIEMPGYKIEDEKLAIAGVIWSSDN